MNHISQVQPGKASEATSLQSHARCHIRAWGNSDESEGDFGG